MKSRLIPEIELANIASLPKEFRRSRLEKIEPPDVYWNYNPTRQKIGDIFNCMTGLFGAGPPVEWSKIAREIIKISKSPDEAKYNLAAAKALHEHARNNRIISRFADFFPLTFSYGPKVTFWSPVVFVSEAKPVIPFIDPRLSMRLTPSGRIFAFSAMHERIRAIDPDFSDSTLAILQLKKDQKEECGRKVVEYTAGDAELMSFEDMDKSVTETYQIWEEIERDRTKIRRIAGGRGTLI